MKKFIVLSGSVDGSACENEGFVNCANFGLVGTRAYGTLAEAAMFRDETIDADLGDFKSLWPEEDGYTMEVGSMKADDKFADKYLDVYYEGDVINETIYKIVEIEC